MSTFIELAAKRLREFMETNNATAKEMDVVLGLRKGCTLAVLRDKQGTPASMWSENIAVALGANSHALEKLNELRHGNPKKDNQTTVEKKETTPTTNDTGEAKPKLSPRINQRASNDEKDVLACRLRAFKTKHNLSWDEVAEKLTASGIREYKGSRISVQIAPSSSLNKSTVDEFNKAITFAEQRIHASTETEQPEIGPLQDEAKKRYLDIRNRLELMPDQMVMAMNEAPAIERTFSKNALSVCLSPSGLKELSDPYARDIINAVAFVETLTEVNAQNQDSLDLHGDGTNHPEITHLSPEDSQAEADLYGAQFEGLPEVTCIGCGCTDSHECEGGCTWLAMNTINQTGVCTCCEGEMDRWIELQQDLNPDDKAPLPGHVAIFHTALSEMIIKTAAKRYLENELGISIEELKSIETQIESLLYAKRHELKATVIVPMHEVKLQVQ